MEQFLNRNYVMAEGESINDLLEKAGGYTENAYPFELFIK